MRSPYVLLCLLLVTYSNGQNPFLIKDIGAFPNSSFESNPSKLVQIDNTLFFYANDGSAAGLELWRSDGTESGTELIADVNSNTDASY